MKSFATIRYNKSNTILIRDWIYSDAVIFGERKNVSNENSLLLDNLDCSNDNSCIIEPTIYNFHKF